MLLIGLFVAACDVNEPGNEPGVVEAADLTDEPEMPTSTPETGDDNVSITVSGAAEDTLINGRTQCEAMETDGVTVDTYLVYAGNPPNNNGMILYIPTTLNTGTYDLVGEADRSSADDVGILVTMLEPAGDSGLVATEFNTNATGEITLDYLPHEVGSRLIGSFETTVENSDEESITVDGTLTFVFSDITSDQLCDI